MRSPSLNRRAPSGVLRFLFRPRSLFLGLAVVFAVGAIVALDLSPPARPSHGGDQRNGSDSAISGLRASASTDRSVSEAELARSFAILRTVPERIPAPVRRLAENSLGTPRTGLNFRKAWRFESVAGTIWLVGGEGVVCLLQARRGAITCTTATRFRGRGLALGLFNRSSGTRDHHVHFALVGVVPDGITRVALQIESHPRVVPVHDNTYGTQAAKPILVHPRSFATDTTNR